MHFLSKIGYLCHAKIANEGDMWSKLSKKRQKTKDKRQKQAMDFLGQPLKTIKNYYNEQDLFTN